NKILEGYDIVFGKRFERKDNFLKRLSSTLFWKAYDILTEQKNDKTIANFGMYSKKVIQNCLKFKEQHRNFPLTVKWLGFKSTAIDITHQKRLSGKSSYSFSKLINFAINSLISYSNKPLKYMVFLGFLISFMSFIYGSFILIKYAYWGSAILGWSSLIVSMYFLSGTIILSIGILGIYIGKIFNETKSRPLYIVNETLNIDKS
ncbi:MAG: hypothetical protein NWP61_03365, partial [Rickettsiaceae bacterium]|nr:hypothetical protein [Rickettsiaceae bacterium]